MLEQLITLILGFVLGWTICKFWMATVFRTILSELGVKDKQLHDLLERETEEAKPATSVVDIEVELVGSRLYAYRKDNNSFLGYGDSAKELVDVLVKQLPTGTRVRCLKEHGGQYLESAMSELSNQ